MFSLISKSWGSVSSRVPLGPRSWHPPSVLMIFSSWPRLPLTQVRACSVQRRSAQRGRGLPTRLRRPAGSQAAGHDQPAVLRDDNKTTGEAARPRPEQLSHEERNWVIVYRWGHAWSITEGRGRWDGLWPGRTRRRNRRRPPRRAANEYVLISCATTRGCEVVEYTGRVTADRPHSHASCAGVRER